MRVLVEKWLFCTQGGTAIEYGLMLAGIVGAVVSTVFLMGDDINYILDQLTLAMHDAIDAPETNV